MLESGIGLLCVRLVVGKTLALCQIFVGEGLLFAFAFCHVVGTNLLLVCLCVHLFVAGRFPFRRTSG